MVTQKAPGSRGLPPRLVLLLVCGLGAGSMGTTWERAGMQTLRPCPRPTESESAFLTKCPGALYALCNLKVPETTISPLPRHTTSLTHKRGQKSQYPSASWNRFKHPGTIRWGDSKVGQT